jgi:acid phosphatase type 7
MMQRHDVRNIFWRSSSAAARLFCLFGAVTLFGAAGCVGGCAGTGGNFNTPQMNTPTLNNGGVNANSSGSGNRSANGTPPTAQSEANLPPLEKIETPKDLFTIAPYLQLGGQSAPGKTESVTLSWTTPNGAKAPDAKAFAVEVRPAGTQNWLKTKSAPTVKPLAVPGTPAQKSFRAAINDLTPGAFFDYRISHEGKPVFIGRARARKAANQPLHFVVFGDTAEGSANQKRITYQAHLAKPDFIFITGDIVYDRGRASEYLDHFFPIFNADEASETTGAPLLRSTLFLAAVGNHDTAYKQLDKWPDGLAYFYFWDLPKNGPNLAFGAPNSCVPTGNPDAQKILREAAGNAFPRMANYSFDYGATHWLVLDSNYYVDWSNDKLRAWAEKDLKESKATWKFVAFHHPPFQSSNTHKNDQFMRVLADVFEKHGVDVVWSGHVHNYQRSHPLKFVAERSPNGQWRDTSGRVAGKWTLDKTFDGEKNTKTTAPIYIVTGGGGAGLYDRKLDDNKSEWQDFTAKYIASVHSLTIVDVEGTKMTVRQLSDTGKELDKFVLTK